LEVLDLDITSDSPLPLAMVEQANKQRIDTSLQKSIKTVAQVALLWPL